MDELGTKIRNRVEEAIGNRVFPGCVIGVVDKDGIKTVFPFGYHTYEQEKAVERRTVYDIASVTKAIAPHAVLLKLIDDGKVQLTDRVVDFLPRFDSHSQKSKVTIEHLLTYTVNLKIPSMLELAEKPAEEVIRILLTAPLRVSPGKHFLYTNSTAMLIALITEAVTDTRLDETSREFFFGPLGMNDTTFHPETLSLERIPPTEQEDRLGRTVHGSVHDEGSHLLQKEDIYLGAAGLFSTASDLLQFLRMLLNDGTSAGRRYFSRDMLEDMLAAHFSDNEHTIGLGWELNARRYMGEGASKTTFGQPGFTGCVLMGDREKKVGIVVLSNRIFPQRPGSGDAVNALRHDVADIVWKYVV